MFKNMRRINRLGHSVKTVNQTIYFVRSIVKNQLSYNYT